MEKTEQPLTADVLIELSESSDQAANLQEPPNLSRPLPTVSDPGTELFAEFAQALGDDQAGATTKPSPVLDLGAADDEVCNFEIDSFDYEVDGDALLAGLASSDVAVGRVEGPQTEPVSAAVSQRLAVLEEENAQLHHSLKRVQAEFENVRRRNEREQD